jgi:hypothetical protein
MDCLPLSFIFGLDGQISKQMHRMQEIVRSDSLTRAFLQLSSRSKQRLYLLERATKKPVHVSLAQLPIGKLFLFGDEGFTLQRMAIDMVLLAGEVPIPLQHAPALRSTGKTPEPAVRRHNAFIAMATARKIDADDETARERRERRSSEAKAKRSAALATHSHSVNVIPADEQEEEVQAAVRQIMERVEHDCQREAHN